MCRSINYSILGLEDCSVINVRDHQPLLVSKRNNHSVCYPLPNVRPTSKSFRALRALFSSRTRFERRNSRESEFSGRAARILGTARQTVLVEF
jgi:hypothetical protein